MTWSPIPEMMWKADPEVVAARLLLGWGDFHRTCGKVQLAFDHMVRDGKRGPYTCTAFTCVKQGEFYLHQPLATGRGKTVVEAVADAHDRSGRANDETRAALTRLIAGPVVDEFSGLMADEFEELM